MVKNGDKVKVHYTGKLNDGSVFDSSEGEQPLEFTLGSKTLIPGFENAVLGMSVGESKTVTIPCAEAYGQPMSEMIIEVPRNQFPPDMKPQVDDQLQMRDPTGRVTVVKVVKVEEQAVTIDANHPLAGQDLTFEIRLVET